MQKIWEMELPGYPGKRGMPSKELGYSRLFHRYLFSVFFYYLYFLIMIINFVTVLI